MGLLCDGAASSGATLGRRQAIICINSLYRVLICMFMRGMFFFKEPLTNSSELSLNRDHRFFSILTARYSLIQNILSVDNETGITGFFSQSIHSANIA
jgi:hypothetical protein